MSQRQYNYRRPAKQRVVVGNLFEELFYETKPYFLLIIAAVCTQSHYANAGLAKFSIGLLFAAAAYIIYRRLVYRGYIK